MTHSVLCDDFMYNARLLSRTGSQSHWKSMPALKFYRIKYINYSEQEVKLQLLLGINVW